MNSRVKRRIHLFLVAVFLYWVGGVVLAQTTVSELPRADASASISTESLPPPAFAAPNADSTKLSYTKPVSGTGSQLLTVFLSLVFIVALIYGLSLFVRKFGQVMGYSSQHIKSLANLSIGTRERVLLIEVGDKQILLGVTPTQINTLHVFDSPVVEVEKTQPVASDFAQKFKAVLSAQIQKP